MRGFACDFAGFRFAAAARGSTIVVAAVTDTTGFAAISFSVVRIEATLVGALDVPITRGATRPNGGGAFAALIASKAAAAAATAAARAAATFVGLPAVASSTPYMTSQSRTKRSASAR